MIKTIKALLPLIMTIALTLAFVTNMAAQSSNFESGLKSHLLRSIK